MAAPKGNQYYRLRLKDGREKEFSPERLAEEANNYFEWCEQNPLEREEIVKYRDNHTKDTTQIMRAFTISGLCNFLDITEKTFWNYDKEKEYLHITTRIKSIIRTQKFEGAAAGLLQPMIIARDLGLKDQKELDVADNRKSTHDLFPPELDELDGSTDKSES